MKDRTTSDFVFGIDLGTTNSVIAFVDEHGVPQVVRHQGEALLPSVVGVTPDGEMIVGAAARNQLVAYPELTIASIKRRMGEDVRIPLGTHELTPQEISAAILRELVRRARTATGIDTDRVVITVPAFFRDAQRQATRMAGEIAGLEVVRIVHEPTAAVLAFDGPKSEGERLVLCYDLGGGTFDASLVLTDGELVEVLASHGDVLLGGDDFDRALAADVARRHGIELGVDRVVDARLIRACEQAKIRLTEVTSTELREEFLGTDARGTARHVVQTIDRERLEELLEPWLERTLDSVHETLKLAGKQLADVDDVLLVGGSTRSPIFGERLRELLGKPARRDVDPDLCVALGAAILGARVGGRDVGRVLVDVTPHSFGPSHTEPTADGYDVDRYAPLIERGTPLPVTRSRSYYTMVDDQSSWDVRIFQGESPDPHDNVLIGRFMADGFSAVPAGNEVVCKMALDLDGILSVEIVERISGQTKRVTIDKATAVYDDAELAAARERTRALWGEDDEPSVGPARPGAAAQGPGDDEWMADARKVIARARAISAQLGAADRAELIELIAGIESALEAGDADACQPLVDDLDDLVHYAEES